MAGLSKAGENFLKCAYASPDFSVDPGQGIPDGYEGKALMRKEVYTNSVGFTANTDAFFLVMPTPGISYWRCSVPVGTYPLQTTVWTPVYNSSFQSLFGTPTDQTVDTPTNPVERDTNVTKFRYVSNTFEITPTSNFMQYAGSITVWKFPVTLSETFRTTGVGALQDQIVELAFNGLSALTQVSPDNKPFKFIDGAYSVAVNTETNWEFQSVRSGITRMPGLSESATNNITWGSFLGDIIGMGDLQSMVFRVSSPTGSVNSAIIKSWSCVEYQPNPSSAYYQFAGKSPAHDPVALKLYRQIALKVPVAVCVAENDGFWTDRVVPILKSILGAARVVGNVIPPVGLAVSGIDMLTQAFGLL